MKASQRNHVVDKQIKHLHSQVARMLRVLNEFKKYQKKVGMTV